MKRIPLVAIFAAAALILWAVAFTSSRTAAAHRDTALAAFSADLAAGKLSTPDAFEARCGHAHWRDAESLDYDGNIRIRFSSGQPPALLTIHAGRHREWAYRADDGFVFDRLRCQ